MKCGKAPSLRGSIHSPWDEETGPGRRRVLRQLRCIADSADDDRLLSHTDVSIKARLPVGPIVALPICRWCEGSEAARQDSDPTKVEDSVHGHLLVKRPG